MKYPTVQDCALVLLALALLLFLGSCSRVHVEPQYYFLRGVYHFNHSYMGFPDLLKRPGSEGFVNLTFKLDYELDSCNEQTEDFFISQNTWMIDVLSTTSPDDYVGLSTSRGNHSTLSQLCPPGTIYFFIKQRSLHYVCSRTDHWIQGRWYNVLVLWGHDGMRLFIDGVLEGVNNYSGSWHSGNATPFYVGAYPPGDDFYLHGSIRDLTVVTY